MVEKTANVFWFVPKMCQLPVHNNTVLTTRNLLWQTKCKFGSTNGSQQVIIQNNTSITFLKTVYSIMWLSQGVKLDGHVIRVEPEKIRASSQTSTQK